MKYFDIAFTSGIKYTILQKELTITNSENFEKIYDGKTNVIGTFEVEGIEPGDIVEVSATFYDKDLNLFKVIRTQKEIKEYIFQYENKVFKEFDKMIINPESDEVEINPEYVKCLEMIKQLDRIFIYISDDNYIKLYNYNNEKLYYFSGYYGLMVGE